MLTGKPYSEVLFSFYPYSARRALCEDFLQACLEVYGGCLKGVLGVSGKHLPVIPDTPQKPPVQPS